MPLSWHWTDHSGGYWQQVELRTKMQVVQAKQSTISALKQHHK